MTDFAKNQMIPPAGSAARSTEWAGEPALVGIRVAGGSAARSAEASAAKTYPQDWPPAAVSETATRPKMAGISMSRNRERIFKPRPEAPAVEAVTVVVEKLKVPEPVLPIAEVMATGDAQPVSTMPAGATKTAFFKQFFGSFFSS